LCERLRIGQLQIIFWLAAALFTVVQPSIAGNFDLEIHCVARRVDQTVKKASDGGTNETKERWVYDVTIENKTFKELSNLDVNYVIFFTQEQLGVKANPTKRQQGGSFRIDSLKSHEKKSFSTNPVELNKSNLVGEWIYRSGAKPNAQDTLVGLAIRVFQAGQQFADYANPSTLLREKVE
jgi:hypothetical protein